MVIAFLGTKGGTGTTTMSINCATALHRLSGQSTLLVETKVGSGDLAVFLAMRPQFSLADAVEGRGWPNGQRPERYATAHDSGIYVLPSGDEAQGAMADQERLERVMARLAVYFGFVVVDVGAGTGPAATAALTTADLVVLVANPDVLSLRNVRRLSDALRVTGVASERVRVLLNRVSPDGVMPVSQIEQVLGRSIDFQVPSDYRTVASALNSGVPIASLRPTMLHHQVDAMARAVMQLAIS